jgi:hypothetical protein
MDAFLESLMKVLPKRGPDGSVRQHKIGHRIRLRFFQDRFVTSESPSIDVEVDGESVRIGGPDRNAALNTKELIGNVHGIGSADRAKRIADTLKTALSVRSAVRKTGIDLGDDVATGQFSNYVKEFIKERTGITIRDNIHGFDIFEDDGAVVHVNFNMNASVSMRAEDLPPTVDGSFTWAEKISRDLAEACRLLNAADHSGAPVVKLSLSMAALESLAPDLPWSEEAKEHITSLMDVSQASGDLPAEVRAQLTDQLKSMRDFGGSGGRRVRALLEERGLLRLKSQLSKASKIRNTLLHGKYVSKTKQQAAAEAARDIAQAVLDGILRSLDLDPEAMRQSNTAVVPAPIPAVGPSQPQPKGLAKLWRLLGQILGQIVRRIKKALRLKG